MTDRTQPAAPRPVARPAAIIPQSLPFAHISWGSIIAGTICAFALQLLLNLVGLGLGLASVDFARGNVTTFGIGAGLWWGVSAIASLLVGGWIAGRLAGIPIRVTAALHGIAVWALVTLLTVWLATTTLTSAVSGAFGAVGRIGEAAITAVGGVAQNANLPSLPADLLGEGTSVQAASEERASVMRSIRNDARELYRRVVSRQEQERAAQAIQSTAGDVLRNPQNFNQDLNNLIDALFRSDTGVFGADDLAQAKTLLQERFGMTEPEAGQLLANWQDRYKAAVERVSAAVQALKEQAQVLRDKAAQTAAEAAETVGAAAGWTAIALVLGLLAAVMGGLLGKPEPYEVELAEEEV